MEFHHTSVAMFAILKSFFPIEVQSLPTHTLFFLCYTRTSRTLASRWSDLSKVVVTSIALPANYPSFAWALSSDRVAGPRLGADGKALAGVASVLAFRPVVVFLQWIEHTKCVNSHSCKDTSLTVIPKEELFSPRAIPIQGLLSKKR